MNKKTRKTIIGSSIAFMLGSITIGASLGLSRVLNINSLNVIQQTSLNNNIQPRLSSDPEPTLSQLPPYFNTGLSTIYNGSSDILNGGVLNAKDIFNKPILIGDFIKAMSSKDSSVSTNYWTSILKPNAKFSNDDGYNGMLTVSSDTSGAYWSYKYVYAYNPTKTEDGSGVNCWLVIKSWRGGSEQYINVFNVQINGFEVPPSTVVNAGALDFSSKTTEQVDDAELAQAIFEKNYITELQSGATAANISISDRSNNKYTGQVTCKVSVNDNMASHQGDPDNYTTPTALTFTGFKKVNSSMTAGQTINVPELSSSYAWDSSLNQDAIKSKIIPLIHDASSDVTNANITLGTITRVGDTNSATCTVSINNAWNEGKNNQTLALGSVTITGFHDINKNPSEQIPNGLEENKANIMQLDDGKVITFTADINSNKDALQTSIKNKLNANNGELINKLVTNASTNGQSTTVTNVTITNTSGNDFDVSIDFNGWAQNPNQGPSGYVAKTGVVYKLIGKATPAPLDSNQALPQNQQQDFISKAEQASTPEEIQQAYKEALAEQLLNQIKGNATLEQQSKLTPELEQKIKDAIMNGTNVTVEQNGDKNQITNVTTNLQEVNSLLKNNGITPFSVDELASYSNPIPATNEGLAWWAILLIVVGSLLVIALIITLILYKKKNKGYKGSYAC